ncbi:nuclear transport factor 2 family protein [Flavobacteriaceae bacterium KMM 6897]|nr:nuclear transport factor 2 family protein [Flavobacteriaceae bacterium KMM 6897]MEB8346237.1 nuclear transport factor 2 family protein [Flavobacteriaceae bacterium KMM 6898]
MKKLVIYAIIALLFIACQNKGPERYSTTGSEIDLVKELIETYEAGDWENWVSHYADTAKIHHNTWEEISATPTETRESLKANLSVLSSYKFDDDPIYYEKVLTDEGKTWVNFWGNWRGNLSANGKEITIPVHLSVNVEDGKIQEEFGMYDLTNFTLEMNTINNMSNDEKAVLSTIQKVVEAWNTNDKELFKSVTVKDLVRNGNGLRVASNQAEYESFMDLYHSAFPDFKVAIDNTVIMGNKAYINWTVTGTNTGEFMGNPAVNKKIKTHGLSVWAFNKEGKGIQENAFSDNLEVYKQLGYTMPTPQ